MVEGEDFDGDLGEETQELIANVIEFGEADAAEVMTPRTEIRAIEENASLTDAVRVFAEAGYSRIPVYEDTIDSIIGTLTALEAAKAVADGRLESTRIRDVMRPPLIVPETVRVPHLLAQFRAERQKMAIVVDEYGGTAGLVTLADVIAEIVGHVKDEYEAEDLDFRPLEGGAIEPAALRVSAQCFRVAVVDGHTASVSVKLATSATADDVLEAWRGHVPPRQGLPGETLRPLRYTAREDRPQPRLDRDAEAGMGVTLGRLRECPVLDWRFVALAHNTVRGAAGGALLVAEQAVLNGLCGRHAGRS